MEASMDSADINICKDIYQFKIYRGIHGLEWLCGIYGGIHRFQWLFRVCGGIHGFAQLCRIY
jgi:hypothetical protein